MNSTLKKIVNFNHKNKWLLSLHLAGLFVPIVFIYALLVRSSKNINYYDSNTHFTIFLPIFFVIGSFLIHRLLTKYISTWKGYILFGLRLTLIYIIFSTLLWKFFEITQNIFDLNDSIYFKSVIRTVREIPLGGFILLISSIILGIFFEKSSFKTKMKNLFSLILFVWALYKIYDNLVNGDKPRGIDTDGDGILDSFDTDGDGNIDTVYQDLDGDGQFDSIAMDTDGDGIIDTVAGDTSGDGNIDTILSDTDGDGIADVRIKDRNGDGKMDGLS